MKKLNSNGYSHVIIAVLVVVITAIAGIGFLVSSYADTQSKTFAITFYTPNESAKGSCKYGKHTAPPVAVGVCAKQGRTIAVNPKIIPYGTKVCIQGVGTRVAEDTGDPRYFEETAAKNYYGHQHIDVFMLDQNKAIKHGIKKLKVTSGACKKAPSSTLADRPT